MLSEVRQAAHGAWVEGAGRFGLAAKGVSYVLVAILAIQVAVGAGGEPADRQGALDAVADEPFGWMLILAIAAGFAGYALGASRKRCRPRPRGRRCGRARQAGKRLCQGTSTRASPCWR